MDGHFGPLPSPGDDRHDRTADRAFRATLTLIKNVFTREGVEFIDENGGGLGVRLRKSSETKPKKT
jgi:hypothetical protein